LKRDWSKARPLRTPRASKTAGATIDTLVVSPSWHNRSRGRLAIGPFAVPCALGRSGVSTRKREGDGATPFGRFEIVARLTRRDRWAAVAGEAIRPSDGWCDDPASGAYNRPVTLPFAGGHEELWRSDGLYDVVLVLDHNLRARRGRGGSAVFFHLSSDDYGPTAGCVAISAADMRRLLPRLAGRVFLRILLPGSGARSKNRRTHPHMRRA
jgi:L,D-peptidoglycan transpeptidase YkuD (ErfK/YbiS/YcfS/YnhG family)